MKPLTISVYYPKCNLADVANRDCRNHFRECFENWKADLSVHEGEVLRYNTICEIGVNSTNYWQQA
jgi:hypothetical protein